MWQAFFEGLSILSEKWAVVLGAIGVVCLELGVSIFFSRDAFKAKARFLRSVSWAGSFFTVSVILRLAFLTGTSVPPYFDSVEHYRIVKELVSALENSTLLKTIPTLTPNYYHLGFHFLASLLTFGLRANPMDVILVLGQVILAAIPIPIFFILRHETQSDAAASFGMLLAGFGWYMPGFAINWGKYPALAGLLALEIVLSSAYFISLKKSVKNQLALIGLLVVGTLVSTLFHTRSLVIIAISLASWLIAVKMCAASRAFQYFLLGILLAGILVFGILIQREPLLNLTLEPYLRKGLWVTLIVLLLSPFALMKFPRVVYSSIFFILCVFAALFIPVPVLSPMFENQTLLDRPFVEMALYLPLSILGGLGLAGMLHFWEDRKALSENLRTYAGVSIVILLIGFTGLLSLRRYDFHPSDCCNFVGYDDTIAMDWLDKNIPSDARVLIAATQMNVLPSGPSVSLVGTDAGIWIPALTGRATVFAPFGIDFQSETTLEQLCQKHVDYVYAGGTGQTFNAAQLNEKAEWYKGVLFLPHVQLYQLIGCSK
jgi:hypothetical protein